MILTFTHNDQALKNARIVPQHLLQPMNSTRTIVRMEEQDQVVGPKVQWQRLRSYLLTGLCDGRQLLVVAQVHVIILNAQVAVDLGPNRQCAFADIETQVAARMLGIRQQTDPWQ